SQRQQLRLVDQRLLGRHEVLAAVIVAEAVSERLERREGLDVGLLLRGVHASRRERNLHRDRGLLRRFLDGRAAAENDQVSKRNFLALGLTLGLRSIEFLLDRFELAQNLRQLSRLVDVPVLLRRKPNARAVRSAALVGAAERRGRRPSRRHQLGNGQAGGEDFRLQGGNVL